MPINLFGADDLARRCIRLAALSLERYPITGCQVPSAWEILLPAWSFLWTISVWEEFFYKGDQDFLAQTWPWVVRNLQGAEELLDEHGLFSTDRSGICSTGPVPMTGKTWSCITAC